MTPQELSRWRLVFMLAAYGVGYMLYPSRILRTMRNVFFAGHEAATVLEHRLKDALGRIKALARSRAEGEPQPNAADVFPIVHPPLFHLAVLRHAVGYAVVHLFALLHSYLHLRLFR